MEALLYSPDRERTQYWLRRFKSTKASVSLATNEREVESMLAQRTFHSVFVQWERQRTKEFESLCRSLHDRCHWLVALTNKDDVDSNDAYASGFHDCIDDECSDDLLVCKFQHGERIASLESRLSQAQKLESIGELAAGIAHEINTPIQYVGDNTRFIEESYCDIVTVLKCCQRLIVEADSDRGPSAATDELRDSMEDAEIEYLMEEVPSAIKQTLEGVDRVAKIVRAMKEFAHPGVSEMVLTDLAKSIDNTVMVARNEWKYVADLETNFDPNLALVPCFPGEINQVVLNMIVNSAHAIGEVNGNSPENKGTIKISALSTETAAEIRIQDSGRGIAPEHVEKIFKPFFTTKAAGKGTGQGLAIAHSVIVHQHGGTIEVESELGEGTTFVLRLPLEQKGEPTSNDHEVHSDSNEPRDSSDLHHALGVSTLLTKGT